MRSPEALAQRFRETDRKVTPQRIAVFEALDKGAGHSTAEQVHSSVAENLPTISLKTVYEILRELSELGELVMLDLGTGAVRYDHNLVLHHHLVCNECGAVVDIPAHLTDLQLDGVQDLGVSVSTAELVLRGSCSRCNTQDPKQPSNK